MGQSALEEFTAYLMQALQDPPDPNAPLPLSNRHTTIYGVTVTFQILSLVAVGFRLYTRLRIVREPGVDDALIAVAAIFNLLCLITFLGGINEGIGKHLALIVDIFEQTMIWYYLTSAAYVTTSVCIKLSLLFQYLRLFRGDYRRNLVLGLLTIVAIWGSVFMFMTWFPCFPVSGFWDRYSSPAAKCYGFGYRTVKEAKDALLAFSGSNMVLDLAIFLVPLTEYFRPGLNRKQVLAMTGLFGFGVIVILMAVLRLASGLKYNNTSAMLDFTWWFPEVLIFSCLECDFAIICASMPIFWPSVVAAWTEIFVTDEVIVTHDRRSQYIDVSMEQMGWDKDGRRKSHDSLSGLTSTSSNPGEKPFFLVFDPESGRGPGSGIALVEIKPCAPAARKQSRNS